MKSIQSFRRDTYDKNECVIIYGASVYGELAFIALKSLGITPDYFCDRAAKSDMYFGVSVIHPDALAAHLHANIIIASADYFAEIRDDLLRRGCDNLYDMSALIELDLPTAELSERAKYKYDYRKQYVDLVAAANASALPSFSRLQYVVTERCSLRCRDCSHLMQYYHHPENVDLARYRPAFDRLLRHVHMISDLRILGGEPLMNPEMQQVIEWYHDEPRIRTISVYTNGTIVPNEKTLVALAYPNVRVHISQYPVNATRIEKVKAALEAHDVHYYIEPFTNWQTPGNLVQRHDSAERNIEKFQRCFDSNGYSFYKNRLYRCPRAVHGVQVGAMPDVPSEYVALGDASLPEATIDTQLRALMARTSLLACDYCDGLDNHRQSTPPAVQSDHVKAFDE